MNENLNIYFFRNPNNTATMSELFCPGFILEVDKMFNVYITRYLKLLFVTILNYSPFWDNL